MCWHGIESKPRGRAKEKDHAGKPYLRRSSPRTRWPAMPAAMPCNSAARALDRYSLADLANASPALMVLPLWQEVTWHAPVRPPSIEVVPAVAQALLSEPAGARPRRKRCG